MTSYDVFLAEGGRVIVCRVDGPTDVRIARDFTLEMKSLGKEAGVSSFLVDARNSQNVSSVSENFHYAYDAMEEMELERGAKSAILVAPDDHSHDFVEILTQNAGYDVKIFREEEAAMEWLLAAFSH